MSDFDLKSLQRVIFWIEKNTTRWILNLNFLDVSDFEKLFALKNHVLIHFTP